MKTIICNFKSDGKDIKKTAIITDSMDELSKSKKNEATDIVDPEWFHYSEWSIYFQHNETLGYEIVFELENYNKTLKPVKAITWNCSDLHNVVIVDVQKVTVTVK